ncbi:MAG: phosphoenolpyruvate synthase [Chloroflexi bacterium]|nr:phosphoenolpyruvate synthase [Chloroflexota bacterium]
MPYTIPFSQLNKSNIPTAGGKGANLGEMTMAGFPVPAGFVLTTEAYNAFVAAHGLQQQIVELANGVSSDNPQSSATASDQIKQLFLEADIPTKITDPLLVAHREFGETAVAVRSSATAEDLPTASFAGQQDTFLNIRGQDALLGAVKKCWASLWTARAIAYRLRQGIDPASVSLAVVVQTLIPADSSGILFTANPVTGKRDEMLINATWGLGEAIVGGLVTPDTVVVDKSTYTILSHETSRKTVMTVRTEGGTEEQAVPVERQNEQVLDGETAVSLAKLGAKIEAHYNMPMDIEWALANGEIAILQARPITSLPDPKTAPLQNVVWEPVVPNTLWMRRQIVEHMPAPLSPLFEDLYLKKGMEVTMEMLSDAMSKIGDNAIIDMNAMIPQGFAGTINGYAYTTGSFKMTWPNFISILKIYRHINRFLKMDEFNWDKFVLPAYQAIIARWEAVDRAKATDEMLLQGIHEMAIADSSYWFGSAAYLGLSRVIDPVFDRLLKSFLIRYALPKPHLGSSSFLRGFDSKALDAQADMEAIANTIRTTAELRELIGARSADYLIGLLQVYPNGQPVLDSIQDYLDAYGHQIYNLDFVDPTPSEDPLVVLLSLKALIEQPPIQDVRSRQTQMAADRDALVAQIMQALNPLSRSLFGWVWKWTKHFAPYREHVMFYMGAAWPTVRKLARELGQRLTDAGVIAQPDDIYYLNGDEITTASAARANGQTMPDYVQLAQERRALREARKLLTPPPKVPEQGSLKLGPIDLSMFDPTPSDAVNEGAILNGYAVSTGRVTAPASVIYSIDDFAEMEPNSILVCTTTTPAWTPLFSQAVGLVTDVGGALAHGSIVAREYGIPAVMGTGVATERIKSGMMLAVDGDAGTVTLVDEVDEEAEAHLHAQQLAEQQAAKKRKAFFMLAAGAVVGFILWRKKRK